MRATKRERILGTMGLLGLASVLILLVILVILDHCSAALPARIFSAAPPGPRSRAEATLYEARQYRTRAKLAVNHEREEVEEWDPRATMDLDPEAWRLQLMAADPNGDMSRAAAWTRRAMTEARTPAEAYRAAELQVTIEHESGRHEAEFRQALRLLALAPDSPTARGLLARARKRLLTRLGRVSSAARIPPSCNDRWSNHAVAAEPVPLPPCGRPRGPD